LASDGLTDAQLVWLNLGQDLLFGRAIAGMLSPGQARLFRPKPTKIQPILMMRWSTPKAGDRQPGTSLRMQRCGATANRKGA
jgi:hypothetical protein